MATQVQLRRGTATENDAFTGAQGELTFDTTNKRVRIHDGATAGGFELKTENSSGNTLFADNEKAIFGAGSDLQIYHNGTHNFITSVVGNINIETTADDKDIFLKSDDGSGGSATYLQVDGSSGSINLRHYGNVKLATTSTGIDVTGTVTADGLTVDGVETPTLTLTDLSTSNQLLAKSDNTGGWFGTFTDDPLRLYTNNTQRIRLDNNGDISFYEDTGTTAKFFWDASAERLGIGTTSPSHPLTVQRGSGIAAQFTTTTHGDDIELQLSAENDSGASKSGQIFFDPDTNTIGFKNGGLKVLHTDSSGNVGIGTSSPNSILHLSSSGTTVRTIAESTDAAGYVGYRATNGTGYWEMQVDGANQGLRWLDDGTERMRIDSSGNVGIGVTPEAWTSLYGTKALQVGAQASLSDINGDLHLTSNGYYDTTDARWEYINSDYASKYTQINGVHQWYYASSGTADAAITWSEAMRIDSNGNLLVGKTSTANGLTTVGHLLEANGKATLTRDGGEALRVARKTSDGDLVTFHKNGTTVGSIGAKDGDLYIGTGDTQLRFNDGGDDIRPASTDGTGRDAAIDLGDPNVRFKDLYLSGQWVSNGTNNTVRASFQVSGTQYGYINVATTGTVYSTSSDYRLKENVVPLTNATERLKQLNPLRFSFIPDETSRIVDGFLAHEVQDIVPEAITGTKDAMRDEEYEVTPAVLDDDGNVVTEAVMGTRSVPDYQGIDQSKLVPLLVATIKELEARITALEGN